MAVRVEVEEEIEGKRDCREWDMVVLDADT